MIHSGAAQLDALKRRLQERADAIGVSLRKASEQAGLANGYARDIVAGRNKRPSADALRALSGALDCDLEYLLGVQELPRRRDGVAANDSFPPALPAASVRRIPLYRASLRDGGASEVVDSIACPPALEHVPGAYAVLVTQPTMIARYEVGEVCFVHPGLPARPGDYVVVRNAADEMEPVKLFSMSVDGWEFERIATGERLTYSTDGDLEAAHRIVGSASIF